MPFGRFPSNRANSSLAARKPDASKSMSMRDLSWLSRNQSGEGVNWMVLGGIVRREEA